MTTSPVTQVEVVAVKSASTKETAFPSVELAGRHKSSVPAMVAAKKLNNMIWVVDSLRFFITDLTPFCRFSASSY